MTPRVVNYEIPADDPAAQAPVYAALFGWRVEPVPAPGFAYWKCRTGDGPGIDGAITGRLHPGQGPTNYLTVAAIDPLLARAVALGARILVPRSPVPGMGWYAIALDPEGNPVGFWQHDRSAGNEAPTVPPV